LEAIKKENSRALPLMLGLNYEKYKLGQALKIENWDSFEKGLMLFDSIASSDIEYEEKLASLIDSIDVSDTSNIYISIDSRLHVNFGELEDISYNISLLKEIFFKRLAGTKGKGVLDLTIDNPVFIPERF